MPSQTGSYKYGYQSEDNHYSAYDFFKDSHAIGRDNLFGEIFSWKPKDENVDLWNDWGKKDIKHDESVIYKYKKDLPEELKCKCGEFAILINEKYYYCQDCSSELEFKEIKKQFLEKGII